MKEYLQHPIFERLSKLAEQSETEIYVIGGFVRDLFLSRPSKDIDILVIGNGIKFAEAAGKLLHTKVSVFKNFGTAMLKHGDLEIEFVGARKESYRSESRKPIVENGSLEDDQKRRDFSINAMALGLNISNFGTLLDPFDGIKDLESKLIRTPLNPTETFSDDPLRMLRAIRFATQLNFTIHNEAIDAIKKNCERINRRMKGKNCEKINRRTKGKIHERTNR